MRILLVGQAAFAEEVLRGLEAAGDTIAAVVCPPDAGPKPDPVKATALARGIPVHQFRSLKLPEARAAFEAADADLGLLAYVTQIVPEPLLRIPRLTSLCFHPSLLPRYRGGNALAWQILLGATEAGVTVFRPDAGVDTGPIVVQKGPVPISSTDTAASLYFDKLYPLGLDAIAEAVAAIDAGTAVLRAQSEAEASHQGLVDDAIARLDWTRSAAELDRWIRGCDPQPGAWALRDSEVVRCYDARLGDPSIRSAAGTVARLDGGAALIAAPGGTVRVGRVKVGDGAKQPAADALRLGDVLS